MDCGFNNKFFCENPTLVIDNDGVCHRLRTDEWNTPVSEEKRNHINLVEVESSE